jgi:hypothetical protein
MVLGPSHQGGGPPPTAAFVGRVMEQRVLQEAVSTEQMPGTYRIVSVYGVGGQGKSTLLERFEDWLRQQDCKIPFAAVDFSAVTNRDALNGLLRVRNHLHRYGLDSPTFDLAFARYFQLNWPSRKLKQDYPELFGAHEGLVGDLAEIAGAVATELPGGKLVFEALSNLSERYNAWYQRTKPMLTTLDELSTREILEQLPTYLGYDICAFIDNDPPSRPVILFDSWEMLWQQRGGMGVGPGDSVPDAWIRRFAEETPGALFVVAGRRRLHWSDNNPLWDKTIVDCPLSDLTVEEQNELLSKSSIVAPSIRSQIIRNSRGHALSLVLQTRIYNRLRANGITPKIEDFPSNQKAILDRFVSHLEPSLASLLRVTAVANELEEKLWRHLSSAFSMFATYSFPEIVQDALFRRADDNYYVMHEVLRDHLTDDIGLKDPEFLKRARLAHFDFHDRASSRDPKLRQSVGFASGDLTIAEQDKHVMEAATLLLAADPANFVNWCLTRLIEYQETGGRSRMRRNLLVHVKEYIDVESSTSLDLVAKLVRVQIASNPFGEANDELITVLLDRVDRGAAPTSAMVSHMKETARHLAMAGKISLVRRMAHALRSSTEADEGDAIRRELFLSNSCEEWTNSLRILKNLLNQNSADVDWDILSAACYADSSLILKEVLAGLESKDGITQLTNMVHVLDTLILRGKCEKLPIVLETMFGHTRLKDILRTIEDESNNECIQSHAISLLAECLLATRHIAEASQLLESRVSSESVDKLVEVVRSWDLQQMSPGDVSGALSRLIQEDPIFRPWGAYPGRALKMKLDIDAALEKRRPDQDSGIKLTNIAHRLTMTEADTRVTFDGQTIQDFDGQAFQQGLGRIVQAKVELVVNDRGESFVFVNDPLICWRSCDYMAMVGKKLLLQDKRIGLIDFGLVDPRLYSNLAPGYRVLLVNMNEGTGEALFGSYKYLYDWEEASFTFIERN